MLTDKGVNIMLYTKYNMHAVPTLSEIILSYRVSTLLLRYRLGQSIQTTVAGRVFGSLKNGKIHGCIKILLLEVRRT